MTAVYILKEHPEVQYTIERVIYITFGSTFVWIYQFGDQGEPKPIRIKLARISYLKAGKMVLLPKEDEK